MSDLEAIIRWWVGLTLIAAAASPLIWWLFQGLRPVQASLARPVGLVMVTLVIWWPCAVLGIPFNALMCWIILLIGGVVCWAAWLRWSSRCFPAVRSIICVEILWTALFLGYLLFRSANAAIVSTEKPMEIALLSSIMHAASVPAPDPWLAGESINYYYFGYQKVATVAKLVGVPSGIAFNLAIATIFASLGTVSAAIGYRLAQRLKLSPSLSVVTAGLSAFLVIIAGNLETVLQLIKQPAATVDAGWWDGVGWAASRVIIDEGSPGAHETINEFPAFSLILGDLHPHLLTAPHLLAVIAIGISFVLLPESLTRGRLAVAGVIAGLLYASNSWDAPVGFAVIAVVYLIVTRTPALRRTLIDAAIVLGSGLIAVAPFIASFDPPVGTGSGSRFADVPVIGRLFNTIAFVTWRPSSAGELLRVHGLWIALFLIFAWLAVRSSPEIVRGRWFTRPETLIPIACVLAGIAIAWAPAAILLGLPLFVACLITVYAQRDSVRAIAGLFAAGFVLALVPEFIYLQDIFGNRMNTVFKLFFQAWFFLALGSAGAIGYLAAQASAAPMRWLRLVGVTAVIVLITVPYSVLSAQDWMSMGQETRTVDGTAYIEDVNPAVSDALDWLEQNASSGDIIVEVPGCAYGSAYGVPWNRISAYSGIPTLLGWANHERQWRRGQDNLDQLLAERAELAKQWLQGNPPASDPAIVPRFLIFGRQEIDGSSNCDRAPGYGTDGIDTLAQIGWTTAFTSGDLRILVHESDELARSGN